MQESFVDEKVKKDKEKQVWKVGCEGRSKKNECYDSLHAQIKL